MKAVNVKKGKKYLGMQFQLTETEMEYLKDILDYYCFNNDDTNTSDWAVKLRNEIAALEISAGVAVKEDEE